MKRAIIWMLLLTAAMNVAMAQKKNPYRSERQEKVWTDRKAWFNFAYGKQSLKIDKGDICLHSDWGAGISTGRTYYLHRRPILGLMKFGLDWSYFDLNAACYSAPSMDMEGGYYYPDGVEKPSYSEEEEEDGASDVYKGEVGMQFGPSLTVNPVHELKVALYFRVLPCYSIIYADEFKGGYATYFTYGASVSWRVISLGVEQRWGDTDLNFDWDEEESMDVKFSAKGPRFFLSFRF